MRKYVVDGVTEAERPYLDMDEKEFETLLEAMTYASRMAHHMLVSDWKRIGIYEELDGKENDTYWVLYEPYIFGCHTKGQEYYTGQCFLDAE